MSTHQDGLAGLAGLDGRIAPLSVGAHAPDFALPQVLRAPDSSVLGLHHSVPCALVLVFYPMDWEPVSREQLTLYQAYIDAFDQLDVRLLAISVDHVHCHEAFAHDAQLRFPLLADFQPRGEVARRYGVYRDGQGVCARALFVVDRQGQIRFSHAYPDFFNPGVDDPLTTLEALAAEDAEPTEEMLPGGQPRADVPPHDSAAAREIPRDGKGACWQRPS